jgi:hypothetical protein
MKRLKVFKTKNCSRKALKATNKIHSLKAEYKKSTELRIMRRSAQFWWWLKACALESTRSYRDFNAKGGKAQ